MKQLMTEIVKRIMPAAAVMVGFASCVSTGWHFSANNYDMRTATISCRGYANGLPVKTSLMIECRPGDNGVVSVAYHVYDTDTIRCFDINVFEGPYAPALSKKLVDVEVATSKRYFKMKTAVAGSYQGRNIFKFDASALNNKKSDIRTVAEMLASGAETITVTVHDMKNPASAIRTEFPAVKAGPVIARVIRGCCR